MTVTPPATPAPLDVGAGTVLTLQGISKRFGAVQALIFTMLTLVFLSIAVTPHHGAHEEAHAEAHH